MKTMRILVGLAVLLALFGVSAHSAQAVGIFSYSTGFQVQNIDTVNAATVNINFYSTVDGSQPTGSAISDSIPAGQSKTYLTFNVGTGFTGSVVVSSSTKVASVVNILGTGTTANTAASYVGAMSGSPTVLIPLLMKGNSGYNTWFSVQNTGGSNTDINVTYSDGTTASKTGVIPGQAVIFDQSAETHGAKVFSASVTSPTSVPLAAAVIEENPTTLFAYSGFAAGSTQVVMPLINTNNSNYQTGIQIQNAGSSDTVVKVTYIPSSAGTACTETQTITKGSSNTFALNAFAGAPLAGMTTDCVKAKFIGSAQIKASDNSTSQPLVAIVNQFVPNTNGEAYNAFDPTQATAGVVLPLIMDHNSGYWTGISVMNVGTTATVTCQFTNTTYTASASVAPFASLVDLQNGKISTGGARYVGSGTCTAGAGGLLVAVVNELGQGIPGDQLLVYEGISN